LKTTDTITLLILYLTNEYKDTKTNKNE